MGAGRAGGVRGGGRVRRGWSKRIRGRREIGWRWREIQRNMDKMSDWCIQKRCSGCLCEGVGGLYVGVVGDVNG